MIKRVELFLLPEEANNDLFVRNAALTQSGIDEDSIQGIQIVQRSVDARQKTIRIHLLLDIYVGEKFQEESVLKKEYPNVKNKEAVIIVGAGPAGLFSAMKLIELGFKPLIIERGKDVQSRRHDLAAINKEHTVNPNSNYCFGEGGAGTYSDGKLYTRSTKRGDVKGILNNLVAHGASAEIRIDTHPHIGTNKLPKIIQSIRQTILDSGGVILFNTCLSKIIVRSKTFVAIETKAIESDGKTSKIEARAMILASGHSARDVYYLLHEAGIALEAKPFALGLRIEHPQSLIDSIQYHCVTRNPLLPAAAYSLAQQVEGRGVYSFCMCPGGFIVPSATSPGEIVVNGMSPSRRDSKFANSGMVVSIEFPDLVNSSEKDPFSFLNFQKEIEQKAFLIGGKTQSAPAQRMMDFIQKKTSSTLPETSYQPGLSGVSLDEVLPDFVARRLRNGMTEFGKKMKGYLSNEAVLVGVESRTSSPVRIPRDKISLMHSEVFGLFPCGEGAGFAGGIISAALDGERCAESCAQILQAT